MISISLTVFLFYKTGGVYIFLKKAQQQWKNKYFITINYA